MSSQLRKYAFVLIAVVLLAVVADCVFGFEDNYDQLVDSGSCKIQSLTLKITQAQLGKDHTASIDRPWLMDVRLVFSRMATDRESFPDSSLLSFSFSDRSPPNLS